MGEVIDKYQELALQLMEEERIEDAKVLFSVVGEIAITNRLKKDRVELEESC